MKRKSSHQRASGATVSPAAHERSALPGGPGRRRLFRLLALLTLPAALLLTELVLRVAGYGQAPGFFLEIERNGKTIVVPNDRFGLRFFPARLARSPTPWALDLAKPAGACRIFLFGESAALGDPRPAYGMGRYLLALLQERHPGTRFEVVPVAMTAINSHALREMALDARRYDADLWVVYMGNNEMVGPFGAVTVFGAQAPSLGWIRTQLALKSTRVGQLAMAVSDRLRGSGPGDRAWGGLGMFAGQSLGPDDPARARVHEHFRANLRDLVAAGVRRGIPTLVATVASNLRDCGPFAWQHGASLTATNVARWENLFMEGVTNQSAGRPAEALAKFAEARRLDAHHAALRYREGRAALALGQLAEAREHLVAARDTDALPVRADSAINRIVGEVVAELAGMGAVLVDLEKALGGETPPGEDLFLDHVHFNFDGNYRAALELAAAVETRLPEKFRSSPGGGWATQERVEQRLALTDWNRSAAYETMIQRCLEAPFTNQLNHTEHIAALGRRFLELRERLNPSRSAEATEICRAALAKSPDDPHLYEAQAELQEAIHQPAEALAAWRRIQELLPHHPAASYHVGRLLARQRQFAEARLSLQQSLAIRPDFIEASLELGQILFRETNHLGALNLFLELRTQRPDDARVWRHLADPLAALGRRPEALDCLRQAVRLRPGYWEAQYFLGVELAVDNQLLDAARAFSAVLRQKPDHVLARLNLGVALVRLGQVEGARQQFEEVLRQDPQNQRARQHLDSLAELLRKLPAKPGA